MEHNDITEKHFKFAEKQLRQRVENITGFKYKSAFEQDDRPPAIKDVHVDDAVIMHARLYGLYNSCAVVSKEGKIRPERVALIHISKAMCAKFNPYMYEYAIKNEYDFDKFELLAEEFYLNEDQIRELFEGRS